MQPGITCALSGARNGSQVLDNIKAASFRLSEDEMSRINTLLDGLVIEKL
jgi:aryl-alcohol dehydrogenase-like predicted oxidoreductase